MLLSLLVQAGNANPLSNISAESVFGGAVLVGVLWLVMSGRVRIEREIHREAEVIKLQQQTIDKQRETIKALTNKDRETLHLLRELRTAAVARGDLHFSEMIDDEIGADHD